VCSVPHASSICKMNKCDRSVLNVLNLHEMTISSLELYVEHHAQLHVLINCIILRFGGGNRTTAAERSLLAVTSFSWTTETGIRLGVNRFPRWCVRLAEENTTNQVPAVRLSWWTWWSRRGWQYYQPIRGGGRSIVAGARCGVMERL